MAGSPRLLVLVAVTLLLGVAGTVGSVDAGGTATGGFRPAETVVDRGGGPLDATTLGTGRSAAGDAAIGSHGLDTSVQVGAPPFAPPEVDATTTRIRVAPNGSAVWTVEIRTRIANESDRRDYRQFQTTFRENTDRYLGPYRERMVGLVAEAANVTGREMAARNFVAATRIQDAPRQWGVVEYRFRWEGFAQLRDGAVVVGDVFESGYFLTRGDSLVVETGDGYRIEAASPTPDRRDPTAVRWIGPIDFADRRPSVRIVPAPATPTVTESAGGTPTSREDTTGTTPDDADGTTTENGATATDGATTPGGSRATSTEGRGGTENVSSTPSGAATAPGTGAGNADGNGSGALGGQLATVVGGLILAFLVVGGYVVFRREGTGSGAPPDESADGSDGPDPERESATPGPDGEDLPSGGELVTDEELVVDLLESNDGRMRQADVGDRLDWSASKTSRVLSDMAEDGTVEKLRLGNENVIDLADDEA